jgi:flagellar M-ring protein FliF
MDQYRQMLANWWKRWQGLSYPQKLIWSIGVGGSLALAGLLWWASQPEFRVLYTGLSAEDAAAVTSKLQTKSIPFKLAANGSSVLIPADQWMQVHIDMNADGVIGNAKIGKGLEGFDQPNFSSTPFQQHVMFLRAQQSELARTIMQIESVANARVHIVRPEPTPFIREQKATTASVWIKLRGNAPLSRKSVAGIASLVSGSVEGLARENVRIIDQNGKLLSEEREPEQNTIGNISDARRNEEEFRSRGAEAMLESFLGPGKAIVRVTAELDTKLVKKKQEILNNELRATKKEKSVSTKSNSNSTNKGGNAGTSSTTGKTGPGPTSAGGINSTSETIEFDYEIPRTWIEELKKPGAIERLTIAAFVDADALKKSETPISLDDLKNLIKAAVGFKADRDDIQVMLVRMPTPSVEPDDEEAAAATRMQTILTIVRNVSIGAIALCVMPIVWMLFRRRKPAEVQEPVTSPQLQRINEELDKDPEALVKILSLWLDKPDATERKAA